jgi:hypothetical protein
MAPERAPPSAERPTSGTAGRAPRRQAVTPAEIKAKSDYKTARASIRKLIDDLNANAQRAAIMAQINQATARLAEADAHAAQARVRAGEHRPRRHRRDLRRGAQARRRLGA